MKPESVMRYSPAMAQVWDECTDAHHHAAVAQGLAFAHPANPYRDVVLPPERGADA